MSSEAVETAVALLILCVVLVVVVLLFRRMIGGSGRVEVVQVFTIPGSPRATAQELTAALHSLRGGTLRQDSPGHYVLSVRRSPSWTLWLLPLFGVGLILAVILSEEWRLTVRWSEGDGATRLNLVGVTEARVLDRVHQQIHARVPVHTGVVTSGTEVPG